MAQRHKRSPRRSVPPVAATRRKGKMPSSLSGKDAKDDTDARAFSATFEKTAGGADERAYGAMLSDSRLSHPANAPQKADLLSELQQEYGNAYVERVVHNVQATRDDELLQHQIPHDIRQSIASERGSGQPLEPTVRSQMDARFDHSFSNVRVHHDATADTLAKGLGAQAFTTGDHVFFRKNAYDPDSHQGRHLLSHELAHAAQQEAGGVQSGARVQLMPEVAPDVEAAIQSWIDVTPPISVLRPEAIPERIRGAVTEAKDLSDDDLQAVYRRWRLSQSLKKPELPEAAPPYVAEQAPIPGKKPVGGSALADTLKKVTDAFKSIPTEVKVNIKGGSVVVDASGATANLKASKATLTAAADWRGQFKIGATYRGSGTLAAGQMVNLSASVSAEKYSISLRIGPNVTAIDKLPDIVQKAELGLRDLLSDIGSLNLQSLDDVKASAGRIADHVKAIRGAVDACSKLEGERTGKTPPIFLDLKAQFPTGKGREEGVPTSVMGLITIPF